MSKTLRLLAAAALAAMAATAQADYTYVSQGVVFAYQRVDADSFTLRVQNAPDATGNWAPATHLGYLGLKNIGDLSGLTGVQVSVSPAPGTASTWTYTKTELTGQGCNANGGGDALCLDATPDLLLSNDMLFSIDLLGNNLNLSSVLAPHLKVGFTQYFAETTTVKGNKTVVTPAHYDLVGDLLSKDMTLVIPTGGTGTGGPNTQPTDATRDLPEPASMALAGLALAGVAATRRRRLI